MHLRSVLCMVVYGLGFRAHSSKEDDAPAPRQFLLQGPPSLGFQNHLRKVRGNIQGHAAIHPLGQTKESPQLCLDLLAVHAGKVPASSGKVLEVPSRSPNSNNPKP